MTEGIESAADLLVEARLSGTKLSVWPADLIPADAAEAAQIQRAVARKLGVGIGGWKAALFADGLGLAAPIFKADICQSPAVRQLRTAHGIGIEAEIAFWIARDLPAGEAYSRADVIGAVAGASAAMELVESRFRDTDAAPKLAFLADNLANGGLVYGASASDWRRLDLARLAVTVQLDGQILARQEGGHSLGDPLLPLVWLVNHLAGTGASLKSGDIVTTGAFTGLHQVKGGQTVEVSFSGLDPVTARIS